MTSIDVLKRKPECIKHDSVLSEQILWGDHPAVERDTSATHQPVLAHLDHENHPRRKSVVHPPHLEGLCQC